MKIGIYIKKPESVFSNGCIQQTYFLKKLFNNIGYQSDFLSIEQNYSLFELTNEPVIFTNETFDYSKYACVILGSLVLLPETNQKLIDNLVSQDVKVINLICGNVFVLHQEEFVFDVHHILSHYNQSYFTENWVLEMYDYAKDYIQLVSEKPTQIMPYVWDIDMIDRYVNENKLLSNYDTHDTSKVNILMFEPNMSIHKNSLIPLLIANEYYKRNKNNVNKIYMFCSENILKRDSLQLFLDKLEVYKDKRIESYGRIVMPSIIDIIHKNNNFINIVLSYNILNQLNFIHLELFHLGIPIIHNCEPFKQNNLYFNNFELLKAVDLIEDVRCNFNKKKYIEECKCIIDEFGPNNMLRHETYKNAFTKYFDKIDHENINVDNEEIKNIIDPCMFYQGSGYVLYGSKDIDKIKGVIDGIRKDEMIYMEIFLDCGDSLDITKLDFNDLISISVIENIQNINYIHAIKYSSFKEVKFIHMNSPNDIKIYTK